MSLLTSRAKRVGFLGKGRRSIELPEIALLERFIIKHLMTSPTGNSEFYFPENPNVPRGEVSCLKQFSCHDCENNYLLDTAGKQICRGFKSARSSVFSLRLDDSEAEVENDEGWVVLQVGIL